MTRTPRQSFLLTGQVKAFQSIVASEAFEVACDYALLELSSEINDPMNPTGLAQIIGARKVLEILKTLHEPVTTPKPFKRPTPHYDNPNPSTTSAGNDD